MKTNEETKLEEIIGQVRHIVYRSEETFYTVMKVELLENKNTQITMVGNIEDIDKNIDYVFYGEYIIHPTYGNQFKIYSYKVLIPDNKDGIIRYLTSPIFPGIGKKKALKLVEGLGEDLFDKIRNNYQILEEYLSKKDANSIIQVLENEDNIYIKAIKNYISLGLSVRKIELIKELFQDKMIDIIEENPYQVLDHLPGIGFRTMDNFSLKKGIDRFDSRRLEASFSYVLDQICFNSGDTFTSKEELKKYFFKFLSFKDDLIFEKTYLDLQIKERIVELNKNTIYSYKQFIAEKMNAFYIRDFLSKDVKKIDKSIIREKLDEIEKINLIKYDLKQEEAIFEAINSSFSIINGGPGSGKTTIVKAIMDIYTSIYPLNTIKVCAPTGRAAKRISELSGYEATTIHSLLKFDLDTLCFKYNCQNQISGDLLIIDEFSMVDNYLFYKLLNACEEFRQVIIIGDEDQIPSVGAGDLLKNLITIKEIKNIRLDTIYRQQEKSNIIRLSNIIKKNLELEENVFSNDINFIDTKSDDLNEIIFNIIKELENNNLDKNQLQIIAPMYKGISGIDNLNLEMQNYFNPLKEGEEIQRSFKKLRLNDRVIQLKNQAEDNVFNGDIGIIKTVEIKEKDFNIVVDFLGIEVSYNKEESYNLDLAYTISVHKSQGSEFEYVIFPFTKMNYHFLNKNLVYTALTRAKRKLFIIGELELFKQIIKKENQKIRKTNIINFYNDSN